MGQRGTRPRALEKRMRAAAQRILHAGTVLVSVVIAGCGGGSDTSNAAAATAPAAALSAPAAAFLDLDLGRLADYVPVLPAYYDAAVAATDNAPRDVAPSNAVATLGRVLFHDVRLSVNNTISCASCHQAALGFSDAGRFSLGFAGTAFTTAHSMRLGNLRYWAPGNMFWDRRAVSAEAQATQPIQHPVEMGFDASNGGMAALLSKMQGTAYYPELFAFAFGDAAITEERIQRALAQFERAMVSVNSRWDSGYAQVYSPALPDRGLGAEVPGLTVQENRGRHLFVAGPAQGGLACAACHAPPTFALAATSRSNGLDAGETLLFKAPSLKSVGLATAFMHDGRFSTLEQVVEHYNSGVLEGPALDNRLRGPDGRPRRLNLTDADKAALAAFLRTLDDGVLAADPRFSSPFRR
jgi:cytochrome c peroxidase